MKTKLYILILIISTISCINKIESNKTDENQQTINKDTLFEKKIPVITFNTELKKKLDLIIEKVIKSDSYKKKYYMFRCKLLL
jgi:hypothetical protein